MRKPFNLEEAINGGKIVTRDGMEVSEWHYFNGVKPEYIIIFARVNGFVHCYSDSGVHQGGQIGEGAYKCFDLFMEVEGKMINGVECPMPETVPPKDLDTYYIPYMSGSDLCRRFIWKSDEIDKRNLERGLVFLERVDAIKTAKAMLGLLSTGDK